MCVVLNEINAAFDLLIQCKNVIVVLGGLVLKIDNSDLEIGRTLGEGGFGEVRKGMWKSRKAEVAVKTVLTKSKFEDEVSYTPC